MAADGGAEAEGGMICRAAGMRVESSDLDQATSKAATTHMALAECVQSLGVALDARSSLPPLAWCQPEVTACLDAVQPCSRARPVSCANAAPECPACVKTCLELMALLAGHRTGRW
jgi:hypothetical protein